MHEDTFSIRNTTRRPLPRLPFREIKEAALGKDYELSLVFCGDKLSRRINRETRGKDRPTNVLSFPLEKKSGEIFLCLPQARREHEKFERGFDNFIGFLLIHGLIHLKGYDHGSRMESEERKVRERFGI